MRRHFTVGTGALWVALAALSGSASAQGVPSVETGLSPRQLMIRLTNGVGVATGVSNIGEVIGDLVGLDVSTAPIGSSAGGFTYTFDPATRSFSRAASSFGPTFGERAITSGQGRGNVGVNYISSRYDTLEGIDLHDGSLHSVALAGGGTVLYRGAVDLDIRTETVVMFATVALNDWFDVGVAVPYVRLQISGTHRIGDEVVDGHATASGLGDVALRAKIRLHARREGGVALGLDARIPTGDTEALLGAGVTRTLVSGIWSGTFGPLAPHASLGVEIWNHAFRVYDPLTGSAVDAGRHGVAYTAGVEWAAADRLTVGGEVVGRSIAGGGRLDYRDLPLLDNPFGLTTASIASVRPAGLHRVSAAAGVKWNVAGSALLTASLLVPVDRAGLRDRLTPVVGFDWGL